MMDSLLFINLSKKKKSGLLKYIININILYNIRWFKIMINCYMLSVLIFKKLQTTDLLGKNYLRTVVYKVHESKKVFTKV